MKSLNRGVWTAIVTPMLPKGDIDWSAFESLVGEQIDANLSGIVVCGTTGESPTLSRDEKLELVARTKRLLPPNIHLMVGTGGNDTEQSIQLSREAVDAGADSLLIVTPPYNKPSIAGLKKHFSAIADAVTVPLCLYHVPGRTAQRLTALQLAEVVKSHSRILAVKEASGDITLFTQVRSLLPKHLILSGDDLTYLASLAVGGDGCISVASNVLPSMMVGLTKMFWNGQVEESLRNNLRFFPIFEALFCETNPGPVKWMLNQRAQISSDHMRAPLTTLEVSSKAICRRALEQVGL